MRASRTRLDGPILIEPAVFPDDRGFFLEVYRRNEYEAAGVSGDFVQDNHSRSTVGTVRALHFQAEPGQPKIVRVARGRAFDVVVDLRRSSPTFGEWESVELDDVDHRQLYIPVGFAHGFCAVSPVVDLVYKVGSYYDAATERGILWNDPDIGIAWPVETPALSARDRANPLLRDVLTSLPPW
jgi:dTDP-4-dehydrorhamnose 3,5-epimerase